MRCASSGAQFFSKALLTTPRRTITALAVVVSALGYAGIISLYYFIFRTSSVFTIQMLPQVWRIFTAFLITKPKFGILMDPYLLYQYGSGLERESNRFPRPGDFFVYTIFVGSIIVVSLRSCMHLSICSCAACRIDTSVCDLHSVIRPMVLTTTSDYLPAQPIVSS